MTLPRADGNMDWVPAGNSVYYCLTLLEEQGSCSRKTITTASLFEIFVEIHLAGFLLKIRNSES